MSGIYIPGMEMPPNCWRCSLSQLYDSPRERLVCKVTHEEVLRHKIAENCPLIPVPNHGRLGDLDALIDKLPNNLGIRGLDYLSRQESAIVSWIHAAPTIIPAEAEEEK